MRHLRLFIVPIAVLALVSCNRDPNVAKQTYLKKGNDWFDRGKYKEARLMYKDALQQDRKFDQAYYRLGLTELKLGNGANAVQALQRALELLPPDSKERMDCLVKLSEVYLVGGGLRKDLLDEVGGFTDQLLKHDPNSFDGHRLKGDLSFQYAHIDQAASHDDEVQRKLKTALGEYETARKIKPDDVGVNAQIARVLMYTNHPAESEKRYREIIAQVKTLRAAYVELYTLLMAEKRPEDAEQVLKLAYQNNPKEYDYLVLLARHYAAQRRTSDMVATLQQIKANAKDYKAAYFTVGDFYLLFGDGDAAIKEYREGVDKDPKQKGAYETRIVEVLVKQGKRSEAADLNAKILKQDPNNNDAKAQAATLMLDKGNVKQALVDLQAAVTRTPNNPSLRFQLGRAHVMNNDPEQARQEFQKAIDLNARFLPPRLAMAQLQVGRGEYDAAVKTADAILAVDPRNVNGALFKAAGFMGQNKYQEAQPILDALIKANPNWPDTQYNYALLNMGLGKYKEAEAAFRKTYELNPADPRGMMGLVETYIAQNKTDLAISTLQTEIAKSPTRPEFRIALGNSLARAGKFDAAIVEFQKVLDSSDKKSKLAGDVYIREAEVYRRKGDDASSLTALQHAREILPDSDQVLITLALTLERLNRWTEARQLYEAALKVSPRNPIVLNNLAMLQAEHGGDLEDALTKAQRAKQLVPNVPDISDTLAWIYVKKGLSDSALDILRDITTKVPNNPTFHFHLGVALWQKGDKAGAGREYQLAMKNNPQPDEKQKIQEYMQKVGL